MTQFSLIVSMVVNCPASGKYLPDIIRLSMQYRIEYYEHNIVTQYDPLAIITYLILDVWVR